MDEEQLISMKGYIRAFKWQGLRELLFAVETATKTNIEILERDRGWLLETIYFKIKGKYRNVKIAVKGLEESMESTEEKGSNE